MPPQLRNRATEGRACKWLKPQYLMRRILSHGALQPGTPVLSSVRWSPRSRCG